MIGDTKVTIKKLMEEVTMRDKALDLSKRLEILKREIV